MDDPCIWFELDMRNYYAYNGMNLDDLYNGDMQYIFPNGCMCGK